mgnify:CR=1 FL=1
MIIKASQRGGSRQLGLHLLKTKENEHVEIHEIRGFMADSVLGAMKEAQAIAMGTKCKQHLFSTSINPPAHADVSPEEFEVAIAKIEERMALTNQPRIIVFHEKEGRRHAHAVWSRIKTDEMKAVQLSHYKTKLHEVSKELFLEHGFEMPAGMRDKKNRDPRSFTLDEWQQAKRMGKNAKDLKTAVQDAWSISDNRKAFERALEDHGMLLAKGDRRGHFAVTYEGEAVSIARYAGKKAKEVRERLGKPDDLRSVAETKSHIADFMTPQVQKYMREARFQSHQDMKPLQDKRLAMIQAQKAERQRLEAKQKERWQAETNQRAARMRKGLKGLWDKLTGKHAEQRRQNEQETFNAYQRDKQQAHDLRKAQLDERRKLQEEIQQKRMEATKRQAEFYKDLASYKRMQEKQQARHSERFNQKSKTNQKSGPEPQGPELER